MILNRTVSSPDINQQVPHKQHIFIGLGSLASLVIVVVFLTVAGKSHRVSAAETNAVVFQIESPKTIVWNPTAVTDTESAPNEITEELELTSNDGLELVDDGGSFGLRKAGTVQMTKELAKFSQGLSKYFAQNKIGAYITSAVRTSERQLDIIKERIESRGMMSEFPGLRTATVGDTASWIAAWEWLKDRHVPVDPPTSYVKEDGNTVRASLHTQGLAIDLSAPDLDLLADELAQYKLWVDAHPTEGLQISGLLREHDCVHISLAN